MLNAYMIGFTCGFLAGLILSGFVAFLLYIFRAKASSFVADVKKTVPSERGSFIETDETLTANKKEIWS